MTRNIDRRKVFVSEIPSTDGRSIQVLEAECLRQDRKVPLQSCLHCPAFRRLESGGPGPLQVACSVDDGTPVPPECPSSDDTALELMSPARAVPADATLDELERTMADSASELVWILAGSGGLHGSVRHLDLEHARANGLLPDGEWTGQGAWKLRAKDIARPALYWSCPSTPLRVIAEIMSRTALPAIPIVDDGKLIGQVLLSSVMLWLDALRSGLPLRDARKHLR